MWPSEGLSGVPPLGVPPQPSPQPAPLLPLGVPRLLPVVTTWLSGVLSLLAQSIGLKICSVSAPPLQGCKLTGGRTPPLLGDLGGLRTQNSGWTREWTGPHQSSDGTSQVQAAPATLRRVRMCSLGRGGPADSPSRGGGEAGPGSPRAGLCHLRRGTERGCF